MKIITVQFDYPPEMNRPKYSILLDVFRESIKQNMPGTELVEINIEPPMVDGSENDPNINFLYNTIKLRKWVECFDKYDDDLIFADCDMLMISSAEHAFDQDFDVAFTERTIKRVTDVTDVEKYWGRKSIDRMPMNGGIMFARNNQRAKDFFNKMLEINDKMYYEDEDLHQKWRIKYAGMNQAAFGCVYEEYPEIAKVIPLPCRIWNAVDGDWHAVNNHTIFMHVKSKLRKLVMTKQRPYGNFKVAMQKWYDIAESIGIPIWREIQ